MQPILYLAFLRSHFLSVCLFVCLSINSNQPMTVYVCLSVGLLLLLSFVCLPAFTSMSLSVFPLSHQLFMKFLICFPNAVSCYVSVRLLPPSLRPRALYFVFTVCLFCILYSILTFTPWVFESGLARPALFVMFQDLTMSLIHAGCPALALFPQQISVLVWGCLCLLTEALLLYPEHPSL